jgi:hypothetical protein
VTISAILERTDGLPSVPLDDAYIHFQFARGFAGWTPFVYTPGTEPVAGATSLLWPLVLAPLYWLGVDGVAVIWGAWLLGFVALGLVAHETHAIARELLSPLVALGAALMVLCFGGLTWLAASGMEAVPFAWLWLRTFRRLAEWYEAGQPAPFRSALGRELLLLSAATPLMRPEGVIASLAVGIALSVGARGRERAAGLVALAALLSPRLVLWLGTGSTTTTTALVKWLPNSPYLDSGEVVLQVLKNLALLYGTLFDGELWSATVVPAGGKLVAVFALPALVAQSYRSGRYERGACVLLAALGMFLPATYDSFLWNRLRYLWPFAPAWFVALGALCDLFGDAVARFKPGLKEVRAVGAGLVAGAFAAKLPFAIDDVAESAWAIQEQQAALGHWARDQLPRDARIGLNDTGAIAYFSGRRTFDVVGLTTRGEGMHWLAGAGSRFEHYERLPRSSLPTHFIVYPEWFALDPLLGKYLTERHVNASILGGSTMVAREADYAALRTAARPVLAAMDARRLIDELDVADLVSEAAHGYRLFDATQVENQVFVERSWVDGGRAGRTREQFQLRATPRGTLILRLTSDRPTPFEVRLSGRRLCGCTTRGLGWDEQALDLPASLPAGVALVTIETTGGSFASLYYFSFGEPSRE